ncbi:MAG: hypothetical protein ACJAYP_001413 [Flavobacterium sp.]
MLFIAIHVKTQKTLLIKGFSVFCAVFKIVMAWLLSLGIQIILTKFTMNPFNICPNCNHLNSCVLTSQKEKVWSCSDYEEQQPKGIILEQKPEQQLELVNL